MSRHAKKITPERQIEFACTVMEYNCIFAAAMALRAPVSLLLTTAALEAAHSLGYYEGFVLPRRAPPGAWTDLPLREHLEAVRMCFTASVPPLHLQTIVRAAKEQLGDGQPVPVQTFMIGSTLRFLATLHLRLKRASQDTSSSSEDREVVTAFLADFDACFQRVSKRTQARFEVPGYDS